MANFSEISSTYKKDSIIQKSASEILFDLLDIQPADNVLDLGCGTGHITGIIRGKTRGRVVGVDPSEGMIEQAKSDYAQQDITFHQCSAEQLGYRNEFDIIFCNSAFQWFTDYKKALQACYDALRWNGKMAIQAPAKDDYCPNFIQAIESVRRDRATKGTFSSFKSPWLFRNTAEEYAALFEEAGFSVKRSSIDTVVTSHSADEVLKIFESGAAAGYLNQKYYGDALSRKYTESFRDIIKRSFQEQAGSTGNVDLVFHRIYLLAVKKVSD